MKKTLRLSLTTLKNLALDDDALRRVVGGGSGPTGDPQMGPSNTYGPECESLSCDDTVRG